MNIRIYRFNPQKDEEPHMDCYQVDIQEGQDTIMHVLSYIQEKLDSTLSYYSHSACQHGICGRCLVKYNGKVCLACETLLTGNDAIIEPVNGNVVKDLVVRI